MEIKATKLSNEVKDDNYIEFINIINDIIPLDVENSYVFVANILIEYINCYNKLNKYNIYFNELVDDIVKCNNYKHSLINKKGVLVNELESTYDSLHFINNPNVSFSLDLWSVNKDNLERKIKKYDSRIDKLSVELKEKIEDRNKISLIIKKNKDILLGLVNKINKISLDEINISNLLGKHIIWVRNLNLKDDEKRILEDTLINYVYIRILSFNIIKNDVNNILNNKSFDIDKLNIILKSLANFNIIDNNDYIFDLIYKPNVNTNIFLMKILKEYIKSNNINLDNINNITKNILITNENNVMKDMINDINTVESRKNNEK